jgi:hypothetical protein
MRLWEIVVILLGANAIAAAIMLALRRRMLGHAHFCDSQPAPVVVAGLAMRRDRPPGSPAQPPRLST